MQPESFDEEGDPPIGLTPPNSYPSGTLGKNWYGFCSWCLTGVTYSKADKLQAHVKNHHSDSDSKPVGKFQVLSFVHWKKQMDVRLERYSNNKKTLTFNTFISK